MIGIKWKAEPLASPEERQREVVELMRRSLGENSEASPKTEAFWRWKHVDNPFGPSFVHLAVADRPEPVGLRAFMQWGLLGPAGESLRIVRAVDTATDPDFRRQGIFTGLTRGLLERLPAEGIDFVFNTPNERSLPGYLKMGWQVLGDAQLLLRPLRPLRLARTLVRRPARAPRMIPEWDEVFGPRVMRFRDFMAYSEEASVRLLQAESMRLKGRVHTPRTLPIARWRFGGHPAVEYGVFAWPTAEAPRAAFILRPNRRYGLREVVLADVWQDSSRPDLVRAFHALARECRGDYLIAHAPKSSSRRNAFHMGGFLVVPRQGIRMTIRGLPSVPENTVDWRSWALSMSDLEIF